MFWHFACRQQTRRPLSGGGQCLQQSLELLFEFVLGGSADKLVNELPALEEQHRGDAAHAKLHGDIIVVLDVALAHHQFAVVLIGQLRDDGSYLAAGATPGCPQIYYQWQLAILVLIKILSCDFYFHFVICLCVIDSANLSI